MVHILGASSLSRVIEKLDYNSKRTLKRTITAIPGLSLYRNNTNDLKVIPTLLSKGRLSKISKKEKFIIWHNAVNNSLSRHPSNFNTRLTPKQLQRILIHYKHCISAIVYWKRSALKLPTNSWDLIISDVAWDPRKVYRFRNFVLLTSSWLLRFIYLGRCLVAGSSKNESIRTPQTWHDLMRNLRWESIWNTTLLVLLLWCGTPHDARMYWFFSFSCQKFSRSDKKRVPPLQFVHWKWTQNADSRRLRHQNEPPRKRKQPQTASNTGQTRRVQNERQRQLRICCGSEKRN